MNRSHVGLGKSLKKSNLGFFLERWKCNFLKEGSEISLCHCLETHLQVHRSLAASLESMSITTSRGKYSIVEVIRLPEFGNRPLCVVGVGLGYVSSGNECEIVRFVDTSDEDESGNDDNRENSVVEVEIEVEAFTLRDGGPDSGSWRKMSNYPRMGVLVLL